MGIANLTMSEDLDKLKSNLKRLRAERTQLRRIFTVLVTQIQKAITEGKSEEMPQHFSKLEDKASRLFRIDSQVCDLLFLCDEGEDEVAKEFDSVEEYRDRYFSLLAVKDSVTQIDDARYEVARSVMQGRIELRTCVCRN